MATILKENLEGSKGIISFTHKEKKKIDNPIAHLLLKKYFNKIKKNYFLSMHWGWYHQNHNDIPYIDFHLASKTLLSFKSKNNTILNFCNRNFIDKIFRKKKIEKIYDLISITRPVKFKNIDKIFKAIKKIYNQKKFLKVLIIFPIYSINDFKKKNFYSEIFNDYKKIFNDYERNYITLMPLYSETIFPLSKEEICNFLNLSKIFILPVEKEGASRVIHEALLCGVPVITCKNLKGGGLDYLNENNSTLIDDLDKIDEVILNTHGNLKNFKIDELSTRKNLSEEYQVDIFKKELKNFYIENNEKWIDNCNFKNLDRKLDSHELTLNKKWIGKTNDLNSILSLYYFLNFLLKKKPNFLKVFIISLLESFYNIIFRIKSYLKK